MHLNPDESQPRRICTPTNPLLVRSLADLGIGTAAWPTRTSKANPVPLPAQLPAAPDLVTLGAKPARPRSFVTTKLGESLVLLAGNLLDGGDISSGIWVGGQVLTLTFV